VNRPSADASWERSASAAGAKSGRTYLFSVELEDVRSLVPDAHRLPERVPPNIERMLQFLREQDVRCTFFTTGDCARRYPTLVRDIWNEGHEIACHSSDHKALDRHDPSSFRKDLEQCQRDYERAGVPPAIGFRAPYGSMIPSTKWAYPILVELGFQYSTSVIGARNPRYGWPDFGPDRPKRVGDLVEIPVTLTHIPGLNVPFVGGVYFRILPFSLIRSLFRQRIEGTDPVVGYIHPFDFDDDEERFRFPELNPFFGWLMYQNRRKVFPRFQALFAEGVRVELYRDFVKRYREE
jgi:polysaccharide deacetylase family protein (PEP-CTERM system associated)